MNQSVKHSQSDASGRIADQAGGSSEASRAYAYAFGELTTAEDEAFEVALIPGSEIVDEVEDAMSSITALAEHVASGMSAPRKSLKNSIMLAALTSPETEKGASEPWQRVIRKHEADWIVDKALPGFSHKILHKDEDSGIFTVLVKFAPGTSYPLHRHKGVEQCYVVSGSLNVNDVLLNAGDYIVAEDGTLHHNTHTEDGCLLLVNSMMEDEILE